VYRGKLLITDEAVEQFTGYNLFNCHKVGVTWDGEKLEIVFECYHPPSSFSWSWEDLKEHIDVPQGLLPAYATPIRDRDAIALVFRSDTENEFCRAREPNGDIYEIGTLKSEGFKRANNLLS